MLCVRSVGQVYGAGGLVLDKVPSVKSLAEQYGRTFAKQLAKTLKHGVVKKILPSLMESLMSDFTNWLPPLVSEKIFEKAFE